VVDSRLQASSPPTPAPRLRPGKPGFSRRFSPVCDEACHGVAKGEAGPLASQASQGDSVSCATKPARHGTAQSGVMDHGVAEGEAGPWQAGAPDTSPRSVTPRQAQNPGAGGGADSEGKPVAGALSSDARSRPRFRQGDGR